ncbi:MAG: hypothetical protein AB8B73_05365 [Ekhidna sp.]
MRKLHTIEEVTEMIKENRFLALSGDERALSQLPKGNWIAGTIPYFMNAEKGEFSQDRIFVNEVDTAALNIKIESYDENSISTFTKDRYDNGYTLLILPAFQKIHSDYALNAPSYPGIYDSPVVGWVTGFDLNSTDVPKTFNGLSGEEFTNKGVALHVELPDNKMGSLEIVNIHEEDASSDTFEFFEDGFSAGDCLINGTKRNLAEYLDTNGIDGKSPFIADFGGAKINVCVKEVKTDSGQVDFYGPLFVGRKYVLAKPIADYEKAFIESVPQLDKPEEFSCNCILNYLYGNLESKKIGIAGPATFGEIAYILLNQTLVYMTIDDI